jgi:3-hydroxy-9,10-secoandrosta-1,3,5(10)-triene-9,17-dione monooxygenase reductase component
MELPAFNARTFRDTMSQFCTGVAVVTGMDGEQPVGFTVQSFTSLSLDPPLVSVSPAKTSSSWPRIRRGGRFGINILGADQKTLSDAFARSGADKFAGVAWQPGPGGAPVLDGVLAYIDCLLEAEHEAGDHSIVVGRVQALAAEDFARSPLLFFRGSYGRFQDF